MVSLITLSLDAGLFWKGKRPGLLVWRLLRRPRVGSYSAPKLKDDPSLGAGRMKQQIEEKKRKLRIAGKPVIVDEDNPIYLKKAIAIMIMKLFADLERKRMGHEDKVNIRLIKVVC